MPRSDLRTSTNEALGRCELPVNAETIRTASANGGHGGTMVLRPRSRLKPSGDHNSCLLIVEEGVVALETAPFGGRRQVLDFLLSGDGLPGPLSARAQLASSERSPRQR